MNQPPPPSVLGLLPDATDRRVHAVYDPADPVPLSVCGVYVLPDGYALPDITLPEVIFCPLCMAARADATELRPACAQRPRFRRCRWRGRRFDRRIQQALDAREQALDGRRTLRAIEAERSRARR